MLVLRDAIVLLMFAAAEADVQCGHGGTDTACEHCTGSEQARCDSSDCKWNPTGTTKCEAKATTQASSTTQASNYVNYVSVSGSCVSGANGVYEKKGTIASGAAWYEKAFQVDGKGGYAQTNSDRVIYYDTDCSGGNGNSPAWFFDASGDKPTASSTSDVDNQKKCFYTGKLEQSNPLPFPLGAKTWRFTCGGNWQDSDLTLGEPTCSEYPCRTGYVLQNADSKTFTEDNCCKALVLPPTQASSTNQASSTAQATCATYNCPTGYLQNTACTTVTESNCCKAPTCTAQAGVTCGDTVCNAVTMSGANTETACHAVKDTQNSQCCRWVSSSGCNGCGNKPCFQGSSTQGSQATCATYNCPTGYIKNAACTTVTESNCCKAPTCTAQAAQATCATYSCPTGYEKKNAGSTTVTESNCCQADVRIAGTVTIVFNDASTFMNHAKAKLALQHAIAEGLASNNNNRQLSTEANTPTPTPTPTPATGITASMIEIRSMTLNRRLNARPEADAWIETEGTPSSRSAGFGAGLSQSNNNMDETARRLAAAGSHGVYPRVVVVFLITVPPGVTPPSENALDDAQKNIRNALNSQMTVHGITGALAVGVMDAGLRLLPTVLPPKTLVKGTVEMTVSDGFDVNDPNSISKVGDGIADWLHVPKSWVEVVLTAPPNVKADYTVTIPSDSSHTGSSISDTITAASTGQVTTAIQNAVGGSFTITVTSTSSPTITQESTGTAKKPVSAAVLRVCSLATTIVWLTFCFQ